MVGVVGNSIKALHKVGCEKRKLAMAESRIGLFVDVGEMYHLSKLPRGLANAMAVASLPISN